jgi:hypothetical protein
MKVKQIVVLALVIINTIALAQEFPLGVRAQALGGASVAKGSEAEALFANPALLANLSGLSFTAFYSQRARAAPPSRSALPWSILATRFIAIAGITSPSAATFCRSKDWRSASGRRFAISASPATAMTARCCSISGRSCT